MEGFLRAIPAAATSPYAFGAYAIAAILFAIAGSKLRKTKLLLQRLETLPPDERPRAFQLAADTILPADITAEQWLRAKRMQLRFLFASAIVIALLTVALIAMVPTSSGDARKLNAVLDAVTYQIDSPLRFSADFQVVLDSKSYSISAGLTKIRNDVRQAIKDFDGVSYSLPNGWKVETTHDADHPPRAAKVYVPLSAEVLGDARTTTVLANARANIFVLETLPTPAGDVIYTGPNVSRIALSLTGGERVLVLDVEEDRILLEVRDARVLSDRNNEPKAGSPLPSALDLAGLTMVIKLVPWQPNDVDYESVLESEPFVGLSHFALRLSERLSFTVPQSAITRVDHGQPLFPAMFTVAIPPDRQNLARWFN